MGRAHAAGPLVLLAAAWAGVMSVLGLAAMLGGPGHWPRGLGAGLGLAALAGGQFVFMALAAERWFPRCARAVALGLEVLTLAAFAAGVLLAGWALGRGDSG